MNAHDRAQADGRADDGASPVNWPRAEADVAYFRQAVAARVRHRRNRRWQSAGAVAGVLLVSFVLWWARGPAAAGSLARAPEAAVTLLPGRQVLPDGSIVELKGDAKIEIAFERAVRRVALVRGEAHFDVAKNPNRPFVVQARGIDVRAVGTAFSVQLRTTEVEVLVTHGVVAVEQADAASQRAAVSAPVEVSKPLARLSAGNRVVVPLAKATPENLAVVPVSEAEMTDRLAWRVPRLNFSGTPLAEAIALIGRHGGVHLVLGDPTLGNVQVSGVLRADNVDSLLRMLEVNYAITAERAGDTITLRRSR